jgi:hypothetical protein
MNLGNIIYTRILRTFLQVAKTFVEVYLYFTKRSDNIIEIKGISSLSKDGKPSYNYIKYNVIKNNKNYKVVFSSKSFENLEQHVLDFKLNSDICLSNKNVIVNCHLTSKFGNEDDIDITEYVRYFCYYFKKDEIFDMFLKYLEYEHNINLNSYENITLYMNDFDFSEKVYDIKKVESMKFHEIFKDD